MPMPETGRRMSLDAQLRDLRGRADADYAEPHSIKEAGRHTADIDELGLRVSLTRARYPNRADGVDQYAVTISRRALDHAPAAPEVEAILSAAFGTSADLAVERSGGPLVRMFRVPVEPAEAL